MNLSQILNPPGAATAVLPPASGIPNRRTGASSPLSSSSSVTTTATTFLRFDTLCNGTTTTTATTTPTGPTAGTGSGTGSGSGGSASRKHASSVSVAQLEEQASSLSSPTSLSSTAYHSHALGSSAGASASPGHASKPNGLNGTYQKIKPNEVSNGYSTHTFRAEAPLSPPHNNMNNKNNRTHTREGTSSFSATANAATVSMVTTGTIDDGVDGQGEPSISSQLLMSHNTAQDMSSSTSTSTAKKKPRHRAMGTVEASSFQDLFQSKPLEQQGTKGAAAKRKPAKKGGRTSPIQPEADPQPIEIRFVMSDKDSQDKQGRKQGSGSTSNTQSPSHDSQGEDADQDSFQSSPTPDFERNADGKFRCSWPRCGKEFTVASRLTTHYRIHSGKPPYLCGYKDCQKAFHTSSSLSHHRVVHTDQGLRPYVCRHNRCGATYTQLARLITHQRTTHSGMILFIPQESSSSASSSPSHPQNQSLFQSANTTPSGALREDPFSTSLSQSSTPSTLAGQGSTFMDSGSVSPMSSEPALRTSSDAARQGTMSPSHEDGTSLVEGDSRSAKSPESTSRHPSRSLTHSPVEPTGSQLVSRSSSAGNGARNGYVDDARVGADESVREDVEEAGEDAEEGEDEESDEMRMRKEAALTMTSFREMAMLQHQRSQKQAPPPTAAAAPAYHATHREPTPSEPNGHHYAGNQYYHAPPSYNDYSPDAYRQRPHVAPYPASSQVPADTHSYTAPHSGEYWMSGQGRIASDQEIYGYTHHGPNDRSFPHGQRPPSFESHLDDKQSHHYPPHPSHSAPQAHHDSHYRGPMGERSFDRPQLPSPN